jgi:hypothetical protein
LCDAFGIRKYPTLYVDRPGLLAGREKAGSERVEVDAKPRTKDAVLKRVGEIVGRGMDEAVGF